MSASLDNTMVTEKAIHDLARTIAREFAPERIVLFGSYAYGQPRDDSDVDLLVVMPYEGNSLRVGVEIAARVRAPFDVDVVVRAPEEPQQRLEWGGSVPAPGAR